VGLWRRLWPMRRKLEKADAEIALIRGDAPKVARYLRENNEPDRDVILTIADMLDPSPRGHDEQRLKFGRRRVGKPSQLTLVEAASLATCVKEEHAKLGGKRGQLQRAIEIVSKARDKPYDTVRAARRRVRR
jgi:hypothetical protein